MKRWYLNHAVARVIHLHVKIPFTESYFEFKWLKIKEQILKCERNV